jgi:oligoendopeptidase F
MVASLDLQAYRTEAEAFLGELDREYYLHFSGQQDDYGIEAVYDRHSDLFTRERVEELRKDSSPALLEFAVEGLVGRETKAEAAELARREAALEIEVDGRRVPYREASVLQANEPDPERRAAIDDARHRALDEHLNPLLLELFERGRATARELGWTSTLAMCEELSGIDLRALGSQAASLLEGTEQGYEPLVGPRLEEQLGFGFERLRRADLTAFFRAPSLDRSFPQDRLVPSLVETLAGLGIDVESQPGVVLDTEARPKKSPRAFCAPVRVPDEVYLVIARIGGRDDYAALFHEAGHTEHYAHMDRSLPVEDRYLGDNSVTEGFAFLLEHLTDDPEWLERVMAAEEPQGVAAHSQAVKLVFVRRYCAKLRYELELHDEPSSLEDMPGRYSELLGSAVHVTWPETSWLADVDPFYYAARYLRAWALETQLRATLVERFGPAWFEDRGAGELLRGLWRYGQRQDADELLAELNGSKLDLVVLA